MVYTPTLILSYLLLATSCWGAPANAGNGPLQFPPRGDSLLCKMPILAKFLCPRAGSSSKNVKTSIGMAKGTMDESGAVRFSVKYASAARWQESTVATTWVLPNGSNDPTVLPLACPQANADSSSYSEDCLSMVIYVPPSLPPNSGAPVLTWIHGGSFIAGSATGPGLDGSKLAIATNSIVAVIQYRLGALGFMAPSGKTNLAVKDVINAMKFLKTVSPALGGSASKITLAGQSSGANMIRALLATPSASSLFQSGIIQSDPMNYGFLSNSIQSTFQTHFNTAINCAASDTACQNALSVDSILSAQGTLLDDAVGLAPGAGIAQPIRVVQDGTLITSPLDSTGAFPSVNKPLLITTVLNEAAPTIYGNFDEPLPASSFPPACEGPLGSDRAQTIVDSSFYPPVVLADGESDARAQLELLGTDYVWKCSGWTFARNWVQHGGKAFVGVYTVGATYPSNDGVPFCTSGGICHEDDIQIVFGTVSNPTAAQSALTKQMQMRYKVFLQGGNPNVPAYAPWTAATTSDVHALNLGTSTPIRVGACEPSFWGAAVQYDYQVFGL